MKKAILQVWEIFNLNDIEQDGCSIHIDEKSRKSYINSICSDIDDDLSESYSRVVGEPTTVKVSDSLYNFIVDEKSIRLRSYEMNNLLKLDEIIVID